MREHPILFSAPMVRAILEGGKTQTRRIVKPQPAAGIRPSPFVPSGIEDGHGREVRCPYGAVGDRLWVRETFATNGNEIRYRADQRDPNDYPGANFQPWKPSIHMPRKASRITLEITDVRVQRLQDIGEADAVAEGASTPGPFAVHHFMTLWSSINGAKSWDANPWVWAITFKRLEAANG